MTKPQNSCNFRDPSQRVCVREEIPGGATTERILTREEFAADGLRATAIGSRITVMWLPAPTAGVA